MGVNDTLYSARFSRFEYIEQGRANVLACRVYRDGALIVPTSGTVTVYDASNTEIVSAAAATVAIDGVVTYSLLAASVAASSRGDGWRIEWALVISGVTFTFRTDASLCKRVLYPCWTEADIYMLESSLDPSGTACIHSLSDFSDKIDSAWGQIERWLVAKGNRPNLIVSPASFYDWGVRLTLCDIFEDLATRLNPAYREKADKYRALAKDARDAVNFVYDVTDSGSRSSTGRKAAAGTVWLNGRGGQTGYYPGSST